MKEKYSIHTNKTEIKLLESKIHSFDKLDNLSTSHRIHRDGFVGCYYQEGVCTDDYGYAEAEKNLALKRPYPFELETGTRSRDKTEQRLSDKELMDLTRDCLSSICAKHPDFRLSGSFSQTFEHQAMTNEKGLAYDNTDCAVSASIAFKHKDSKDIDDGSMSMSLRTFDQATFLHMVDEYLSNFTNIVDLPEELIIQTQYYGFVSVFHQLLYGESMALGTSLLSGKVGQKLFSDDFSLEHNVTDKECWFQRFYDGDGCVNPGDRVEYIKNGVLLRGYADKRTSEKYKLTHTGNARTIYTDIPQNGFVNLFIPRSDHTIKELLNGRLSIIPVQYSGGGFNDKGEYAMPVQVGLLCDGEHILGRVPKFTMVSNVYDMFGKDFLGVGIDQPIINDKQILFRMQYGK